jgi:hypothetical protein
MACHLESIENSSKDALPLLHVRDFSGTGHCRLFEMRCPMCNQAYLGYKVQIHTSVSTDEWLFLVPVSHYELLSAESYPEKAIDFIQERRHLVGRPDGDVYWNRGPELAFALGTI